MPGLSARPHHLTLTQLTYTADLLFILATYASKFAVAMFLGRLSGSRTATLSSQGIAVACGVFCVTSILVLGIVPPLSMPWAELTSNIRVGMPARP